MEDRERQIKELENLAEQHYLEQVQALAWRIGEEESIVKAKVEYIAQERSQSKYIVVDILLAYHRIEW